jgi:transposase InsO family protein
MKNQSPIQVVKSGVPMERIATDILGELPETENGNTYILVVSDYFNKRTEAFPMRNMEAETVASIIVEEVIARFGGPQVIHTNQGKQYESRLFQEMCKVLHITKSRTTAYHPQSDRMVERFNGTLKTMLSVYFPENHGDWDKYLSYVMMIYRASEHETTGFSPNMFMLGRETSTHLDLINEMASSIKQIPSHMWVWELTERLEVAHIMNRKHSENAMLRQKTYHDHKMVGWETKNIQILFYVLNQTFIGHIQILSFWGLNFL